jgi:hypothetical protein
MIGHFPTPYPDESFYSVCARYSQRVKYTDAKELCKELFCNSNVSAVTDLPCYLNNFAANLPENKYYKPERIINELTLLPYYSPFLTGEVVEKTKRQMQTANCAGIHSRLGLMASRVKTPKFLKYCFQCVVEDFSRFGENYWHRTHQLPGVLMCWKHRETLGESIIRTNSTIDPHRFIAAGELIFYPVKNNISKNITDVLWKISVMSNLLLFGNFSSKGKSVISNRYKEILIEKGLATYTKSLRVKKLIEQFSFFYSGEILGLLGCELKGKSIIDNNWLLQILRKAKSVQHPLYHILLLNFLDTNIVDFFNFPTTASYFGEPPWVCLNPAASHYKQLVVREFRLGNRSRNGKPIGRFTCDCGFEYIRSGPDVKPEDKFRIDKMVNFGLIWEAKLGELWSDKSNSITKIARILDVDPLTVKKYATKLNLSFERETNIYKSLAEKDILKSEKTNSNETLINEKRLEWINLIKINPQLKLKDLRALKPKTYVWLYENDPTWLKQNLPQKLVLSHNPKQYINWEQRDLELKSRLESEVATMLLDNGRPKQITKTALGKKADCLPLLLSKLDKMPLTKAALSLLIETKVEYAGRKVRWVANNFRNQQIFPSKSKLINSACVYKLRKNSEIEKVIDEEYESLNKTC